MLWVGEEEQEEVVKEEGARLRDTLDDGLAQAQHLRHPLQTASPLPAGLPTCTSPAALT